MLIIVMKKKRKCCGRFVHWVFYRWTPGMCLARVYVWACVWLSVFINIYCFEVITMQHIFLFDESGKVQCSQASNAFSSTPLTRQTKEECLVTCRRYFGNIYRVCSSTRKSGAELIAVCKKDGFSAIIDPIYMNLLTICCN